MWEVKAGRLLGHFQRECLPPLPSCLGAGMGLWEMSVIQGPWASLTLLRTKIRPSWAPAAPALPPPLPPAQLVPSAHPQPQTGRAGLRAHGSLRG